MFVSHCRAFANDPPAGPQRAMKMFNAGVVRGQNIRVRPAHERRSGYVFLYVLVGLLAAPAWAQTTINVPGNAPTIQAAIDTAIDGDTVLVAPGTYVENINFNGKAITVSSSGGPATTIIDGSKGAIAVSFVSGETRTSVINGFTIQNSGASMYPNNDPSVYFDGIKVSYTAACPGCISNPTITNNVITHNYGYGIEVHFGGALISGNVISYTATQYDPRFDYGCDYDDGDGIFVGGTPNDPSVTTTISNNAIEYNVGHCLGGGIGLFSAPLSTVISNNIIANNQSLGFGGGRSEGDHVPRVAVHQGVADVRDARAVVGRRLHAAHALEVHALRRIQREPEPVGDRHEPQRRPGRHRRRRQSGRHPGHQDL